MPTLQELREVAGLTQLELAQQLGVTLGTVCGWERGPGKPRAKQVLALAAALGVSVGAVLAALPPPRPLRWKRTRPQD